MNTERESGLKLYSLGIVLEAKARNSDEIKVWPSEELSLQKGDLLGKKIIFDVSSMNQHGTEKKIKTEGGTAVTAKWIPDTYSNRETPPDVQPGETVKLFRYQDTPDYYWCTLFREPELRALETVRYVFCNIPGSPHAAYNPDNTYWIEFSTHDQHVKLHTSDNNGEKAKYDITINTREGTVDFKDNRGNWWILESVPGDITGNIMRDLRWTCRDIYLDCRDVLINKRDTTINSRDTTHNGRHKVWNGDTDKQNNSESYINTTPEVVYNTTTWTNNGKEFTTHTPKIELDGDVHVTGNEIVEGNFTMNGGGGEGGGVGKMNGSFELTKSLDVGQNVTIAGDLATAGNSDAATRTGGAPPPP